MQFFEIWYGSWLNDDLPDGLFWWLFFLLKQPLHIWRHRPALVHLSGFLKYLVSPLLIFLLYFLKHATVFDVAGWFPLLHPTLLLWHLAVWFDVFRISMLVELWIDEESQRQIVHIV